MSAVNLEETREASLRVLVSYSALCCFCSSLPKFLIPQRSSLQLAFFFRRRFYSSAQRVARKGKTASDRLIFVKNGGAILSKKVTGTEHFTSIASVARGELLSVDRALWVQRHKSHYGLASAPGMCFADELSVKSASCYEKHPQTDHAAPR